MCVRTYVFRERKGAFPLVQTRDTEHASARTYAMRPSRTVHIRCVTREFDTDYAQRKTGTARREGYTPNGKQIIEEFKKLVFRFDTLRLSRLVLFTRSPFERTFATTFESKANNLREPRFFDSACSRIYYDTALVGLGYIYISQEFRACISRDTQRALNTWECGLTQRSVEHKGLRYVVGWRNDKRRRVRTCDTTRVS